MKKVVRFLPYSVALIPVFALAQVDVGWFEDLVNGIQDIVNLLIPLLIAVALLFFIWGLVQFIAASGDEAAKEEGKRKMIWGIIALFVIVSIWGLVALLGTITGIDAGGTVETPGIPGA